MRRRAFPLVVLSVLASACDASFNRDLVIAAQGRASGATTVNGRVEVGNGAQVSGDLRTVNGSIAVGTDARTRDLATVNGAVAVGARAQTGDVVSVNGNVELAGQVKASGALRTVNGSLRVAGGTIVEGEVRTVNGAIDLRGTTVRGTVGNHAGDVRLLDGSLVEGDLVLDAPDHPGERVDAVVIGVGAQVRGTLRALRPVRLYVHPSARLAAVVGATPIPFEGTDVTPDR